MRFANKGSVSPGKVLKSAARGGGVKMMQCSGNGGLFVVESASEIQVMHLENDWLSVTGRNVLAFSNCPSGPSSASRPAGPR